MVQTPQNVKHWTVISVSVGDADTADALTFFLILVPANIEFRVPYSQRYLVLGLVGLGLPYCYG